MRKPRLRKVRWLVWGYGEVTVLGSKQGQSGSRALALNHSLCLDARVLKALEVTDPSKHSLQTPRSFPRKVHTFNFAFHLSGSHRGYLSLPVWVLSHFSWVQLFVTLWTIAHQAPQSMGFSRQERWSGLPCLLPEDLPNPGIKLASPVSPVLTGWFFTTEPPGKPI